VPVLGEIRVMISADITVVKCGGGVSAPSLVCADVAELIARGTRIVIVHGGSAEMARLASRLGVTLRELVSADGVVTRRTDPATLEVLMLALAGVVKPGILVELARHGVTAIGLTGLDAGLLRARRHQALRAVADGRPVVVRGDLSGRIVAVNTAVLRMLLDAGLVPVVSPPALAEDGEPVNVNADRVAGAVAAALGAKHLIFLTAAGGVLRDPDDPSSVVAECQPDRADLRREFRVTRGMGIKLVAAREALQAGVGDVRIAGGTGSGSLAQAIAGQTGTKVALSASLSPPP
jgi:acetylglutamate/LysW-gamma-L-alpha-aminoadipate kinase